MRWFPRLRAPKRQCPASIVLHVGRPKTATTSVQTVLTQNRALLRRTGVLYPQTGLLVPKIGLAQHQLAMSLRPTYPVFVGPEAHRPEAEVWPEALTEIGRASDCDRVILSSEAFFNLGSAEIDRLAVWLEGFSVGIVVVSRAEAPLLRSMYVQAVKAPPFARSDLRTFIRRTATRSLGLSDAWAQRFGASAITSIDYDTPHHPQGVPAAVLNGAGVPDAVIAEMTFPERKNLSPAWPLVQAMQAMNLVADMPISMRSALYDRLLVEAPEGGADTLLPAVSGADWIPETLKQDLLRAAGSALSGHEANPAMADSEIAEALRRARGPGAPDRIAADF